MKVFLTGKPGIGKTTVVKRFVEMHPDRVEGFYTVEVREGGRRVGFEIVTTWGERRVFAHVDIDGPRVSRYGVDVEALEDVVAKLEAAGADKIIVVDEIGKMELLSGRFFRWVEGLLSKAVPLVATVPVRSGHPLVQKIKRTCPVWEVTSDNRDAIPFRIKDYFRM